MSRSYLGPPETITKEFEAFDVEVDENHGPGPTS